MKNLIKYLLPLFLVPVLVLTSCKDDNVDPVQNDFDVLATYMAQSSLDLGDVLTGWVLPASAIGVDETDYSVPGYYIMDLRSADDFNAGHIKDAHNVALANILDEAPNAGGLPILAVCYTGQTSARATGFLKLMGYQAVSLKWGMCGWHSALNGKWEANAGNFDSPNWVNSGDPKPLTEFNTPTFKTGLTSGADILEARVRAVLGNAWTIGKTDLLANPGNYFINNKWPIESWNEYGHISGAYRIDENLNLNALKNFDPSQTVVTYCYTGQTSSITTAWLQVLGFDNAKSLLYGVNAINHSGMLNGASGAAPKKSWKGAGSGSQTNFGYYNSNGDFFGPQ